MQMKDLDLYNCTRTSYNGKATWYGMSMIVRGMYIHMLAIQDILGHPAKCVFNSIILDAK
jgi:hypothetical protein